MIETKCIKSSNNMYYILFPQFGSGTNVKTDMEGFSNIKNFSATADSYIKPFYFFKHFLQTYPNFTGEISYGHGSSLSYINLKNGKVCSPDWGSANKPYGNYAFVTNTWSGRLGYGYATNGIMDNNCIKTFREDNNQVFQNYYTNNTHDALQFFFDIETGHSIEDLISNGAKPCYSCPEFGTAIVKLRIDSQHHKYIDYINWCAENDMNDTLETSLEEYAAWAFLTGT